MDADLARQVINLEVIRQVDKQVIGFEDRLQLVHLAERLKHQIPEEAGFQDLIVSSLWRNDHSHRGAALRWLGSKTWEVGGRAVTLTNTTNVLQEEDGQFHLYVNGAYTRRRIDALDLGLRWVDDSHAFGPASGFLLGMLRRKLRPTEHGSVRQWEDRVNSIFIPVEIDRIHDLLEHQKLGAGFLAGRNRAMLVMSPGLGKTLTAITAVKYLKFERVLVIAPLTLLSVWQEEIAKWLPGVRAERLTDKVSASTQWYLLNPEALRNQKLLKYVGDVNWEAVIMDESILYKSRQSQRSQAMATLARKTPFVWQLTGSPVTKHLDDFFRPMQILRPQVFTSYWRFARNYCIVEDGVWGTKIVGNKPGAEERLRSDLAEFCYFFHLDDADRQIPDWDRKTCHVRLTAQHSQQYRQLSKDLRLGLPDGDLTVSSKLELTLRLMQLVTSPELLGGEAQQAKFEALVEQLEDLEGQQCIVWVHFRRTGQWIAEQLEEMYDIPTRLINGDTTAAERQQIRQDFAEEKFRVLVMNLSTGKYGLSFPNVPMIYVERTFDRDAFVQSMYRSRRLTTTESPLVVVLEAILDDGKPTIDRVVGQVLEENLELTTELLRGHLESVGR